MMSFKADWAGAIPEEAGEELVIVGKCKKVNNEFWENLKVKINE